MLTDYDQEFVSLDLAIEASGQPAAVVHQWIRQRRIAVACQRYPRRIVYSLSDLMTAEREDHEAGVRHAWKKLAAALLLRAGS